MKIQTDNISIEINADGSVTITDQAFCETHHSMTAAILAVKELVESGQTENDREWWVSEYEEILVKMKAA